jgi:alkylation response protein AidB-like acyl-CoA dehydrogenase
MMRDSRINLIFEGSSEIMRLFIAREALDAHLSVAGDIVDPKAPISRKLRALPRILAFYARWYPTRWIGWGAWPRFSEFSSLATHVRFLDRTARRLSRTIFHKMVRYGPKLEKKQATLFRAVDIGAELFAMAAAVARAEQLGKTGAASAPRAAELADLFCRNSRRRIAEKFRALADNDDALKYTISRRVLAGEEAWLESGLAAVRFDASADGVAEAPSEPAVTVRG